MKVGDVLFNKELKNITINTIEVINEEVDKLYNFEVEDNHNYLTDDYLVYDGFKEE